MWPFSKKKKKRKVEKEYIPDGLFLEQEELSSDKTKHHVVDLCEQIIESSRELDDAKSEYVMVTNYLNDIEIVENLPEEKRALLSEYATYVSKLNKERDELLVKESKLSEVTFAQMQEEEAEIPKIVKRLKENEEYLEAVTHDMALLEEEKENWREQKEESKQEQLLLRRITILIFSIFGVMIVSFISCLLIWDIQTQLPLLISAFLATLVGGVIVIRYQECAKQIQRSTINSDHVISLQNHVKIKYVNMKNAVDYMHEKYHVSSAKELSDNYEKYQEMVRQREKFRITNEDLEYYRKQMYSLLSKLNLYDAKIWFSYANAILDKREMVEVKHDLVVRRQKLRSRMEYNMNVIIGLRKEIDLLSTELGDVAPQIYRILDKVDEFSEKMEKASRLKS